MKATDKNNLIDRIKTLEGLTDDERSALLGLLREHKTYGLVWEDKPEEVEERLRNELPVLIEVKDRALTSAGSDAPNHILIEGDNLESLSTLAYTHAGKIDVIYIDPPYNTGKEFVYNDNFYESKKDSIVSIDDPYRHSKWLSFISKRIAIAYKLLKDTGCIIVSIDDNEQAQLKMLLDDIFRYYNFCACLCVIRAEGGGLAKQVIKGHDYCLVYARNINSFIPLARPKDVRGKIITKDGISYWIQEDWLRKEFGKYGNCHYEELIEYKGENYKKEIDLGLENGDYILIPKPNGMNIIGKLRRLDIDSSKFYSILKHLNKDGVNEMRELGIDFDYPKPLSLIKELVSGATFFNRNSTVLDFFAGSGTTLHAVMQLNAEDGGKRQCILCTNNENGICENVTYERNKRVINGYTKPNGEHVEGLHDNNLRYYRTDYVGRSRSMKNMRRLVQLATDMLCIKENLYAEQKTFAGMPTYKNIYRYFAVDEKKMLIIYDERYVEEIVGLIESVEIEAPIKVYVFSPSEDPWEACFESVSDKVELCALPQAIYNTYRRILPKRKQSPDNQTEETHPGASAANNNKTITATEEYELPGLFSTKGEQE